MKLDGRSPVCKPLYTYEEVIAWQSGNDDLCVSKTSWSPRQPNKGAKTLICHDMRGGYLEDRLVQGCPKSDCYRFYHWQYVDIFVYFSHHFVTIPPPTWTIPAHRHGVKVLGTLITEWDDGKRRCEAFLDSEETCKSFADKLVEIADYYGFDGWLVNIENVIEEGNQVKKLQGFVGYLTEQQHKRDPTSEVIWYDSVINTGKLEWQDELNEKNRMFFDVCDGMFLNYCWKDKNLKSSKGLAVDAGRPYDVYVGIDVFGRGCLGDGGFNTCEALSAVNKHDLSAALFANGWVYEKWGKENFVQNESKFWRCLNEFCLPRSITRLPLVTTFCQGQGQQYWSEGKAMMGPWYNQSVQQLQPSYTSAQFDEEEFAPLSPVIEHYMQDAFSGGNCLNLGGKLAKGQSLHFKLFSLDVDMNSYSQEASEGTPGLYASFTYKKLQNEESGLCLQLKLISQSDSSRTKTSETDSSRTKTSKTVVILPASPRDSFQTSAPEIVDNEDVRVVFDKKMSDVPSQIGNIDSSGWKTSYFEIQQEILKNARLTEMAAVLTSHSKDTQLTTVLLGEVKIIPVENIPDVLPSLAFGETIYHDSQPVPQYIEAENNDLDRGLTKDGNENSETNGEKKDENEGLCSDGQTADSDKLQITSNDTVQMKNSDTVQMKSDDTVQMKSSETVHMTSHDTVHMTSQDTVHMTSQDTVHMASQDTVHMTSQDTVHMTSQNTVQMKSDDTVQMKSDDTVQMSSSDTIQMKSGDTVQMSSSDTIQMTSTDTVQMTSIDKVKSVGNSHSDCPKTNIVKCMECFTLQWRVSNPDKVQYYRVFQVARPFDDLKLLGLTILPCFKVTGFELEPTKGHKSEIGLNAQGDSSTMVNTQLEAKFECVVQPILNTGNAVPIDMCKANIKSETFRLENMLAVS